MWQTREELLFGALSLRAKLHLTCCLLYQFLYYLLRKDNGAINNAIIYRLVRQIPPLIFLFNLLQYRAK